MLLLMVMTSLVVVTVTVAIHSNDQTQFDRRRENAFGAATAGVDDALRCLQRLDPVLPVNTCNISATAGSTLTDAGQSIGQYEVSITDLNPGSLQKTVVINSSAWGSTKNGPEALRSARSVSAEVQLIPVGGFFDAIFAGGVTPNGIISFKNNASIIGSVYARTYDTQKNGANIDDLRIVGDVVAKNNDVYRSIWSGGSITMGNNALIQTNGQACGAGFSPGNATLGSGAQIVGNLRYEGTYNGGGSVGSLTHAGCEAPPSVGLPSFAYSGMNYPGWTILSFSNAALANACLAQAAGTQVQQITACGAALGDLNGTVGHNASGTLINANVPGCAVPLVFGGATFTGNLTVVTNCKLQPGGTFSLHPSATGKKQGVFISTSSSNSDDLATSITSSNPALGVLLYTAGELSTKNKLTLAAGAVYGSSVNGKNDVIVTSSNDLADNPPPGFTFDAALVTRYIPVVTLWKQQ